MNINLHSLMRGTIYNLLGALIPIFAGFLCIPHIITGLALERYGALNLAWVFVGYFGFIDLGVGRALTQLVSKNLAVGDKPACSGIISTGLTIVIMAGLTGSLILTAVIKPLLLKAIHFSSEMSIETIYSSYVLVWSIPIVLLGGCFRGLLQAKQRFDLINLFGSPIGVMNFLLPLLLLRYTNKLQYIIGAVCLNRLISTVMYYLLCKRELSGIDMKLKIEKVYLREIFQFGGWVTVGNIVGPLTLYLDRFIIGGLLSLTAVAYYTTPYDLVTRLLILSSAFATVLFPIFSSFYWSQKNTAVRIYELSSRYLLLCFLPLCMTFVFFSREGIGWWIGSDFSSQSYRVMQIQAIGVLFIGVGSIPFNYIQSIGYPKIPVLLNIIEMPIYIVLIIVLTKWYGIVGTAIAWTFRGILDFFLLRLVLQWKTSSNFGMGFKDWILYSLALFIMLLAMIEIQMKYIVYFLSMIVYVVLCYIFVYKKDDIESLKLLASKKQ